MQDLGNMQLRLGSTQCVDPNAQVQEVDRNNRLTPEHIQTSSLGTWGHILAKFFVIWITLSFLSIKKKKCSTELQTYILILIYEHRLGLKNHMHLITPPPPPAKDNQPHSSPTMKHYATSVVKLFRWVLWALLVFLRPNPPHSPQVQNVTKWIESGLKKSMT